MEISVSLESSLMNPEERGFSTTFVAEEPERDNELA